MKMKKIMGLFLSTQLALGLVACSQSSEDVKSDTSKETVISTSNVATTDWNFNIANTTDPIMEILGVPGDTVALSTDMGDVTLMELMYYVTKELDEYQSIAESMGVDELPWGVESEDTGLFQDFVISTALQYLITNKRVIDYSTDYDVEYTVEEKVRDRVSLSMLSRVMNEDQHLQQLTLLKYCLNYSIMDEENMALRMYDKVYEAKFGEDGVSLPTSEDIIYYLNHYDVYFTKHILLSAFDEDGELLSAEDKSFKYEQAEAIYQQLEGLQGEELKEAFHTLMIAHTEDPGTESFPNGYTASPGDMVPEYEDAAMLLEYNEISGITESSYGYHIILRLPLEECELSYYETVATYEKVMEFYEELEVVLESADIAHLYDLDLELYYDGLLAFRKQVDEYIEEQLGEATESSIEVEDAIEVEDFVETEDFTEAEDFVEAEDIDNDVEYDLSITVEELDDDSESAEIDVFSEDISNLEELMSSDME